MPVPHQLDHLIYATPDLAASVAELERRLGVRFLPGGAHPAWGTRNALLPLSPSTYLEVIGPDPQASTARRPELFGIAGLPTGRLVTWAAKGTDLPRLTARAGSLGLDLGDATPGSRVRPDGTRLSWTLTDPLKPRVDGVVPFFVDWPDGGSHPATSGPPQVELSTLVAVHPDPEAPRTWLAKLGIALEVEQGPTPGFEATFRTQGGVARLR